MFCALVACRVHILWPANHAYCSVPLNAVRAEGIIRNTNTLEAFKQVDKTEMIHNAARQVSSFLTRTPTLTEFEG